MPEYNQIELTWLLTNQTHSSRQIPTRLAFILNQMIKCWKFEIPSDAYFKNWYPSNWQQEIQISVFNKTINPLIAFVLMNIIICTTVKLIIRGVYYRSFDNSIHIFDSIIIFICCLVASFLLIINQA